MQLTITFALVLIHPTFPISAAPPPIATKASSPLHHTAHNDTISSQANTLGTNPNFPCRTVVRHIYKEIDGTHLSLDLFICPTWSIEATAWSNTFARVREALGNSVLIGHGNDPMQPDPFVSPRMPGENCSIKIMSTSYPGFTYHENYLALHAIYGAQRETREFDASAFALVYRDGVVGKGEHIGTVTIRPFPD